MKTALYLFFLLFPLLGVAQRVTVSGYIREAGSNEGLPGATVYDPALKVGAATNSYGFYSLTLPAGPHELIYSFVGKRARKETLDVTGSQTVDVQLESVDTAQEVVVSADRTPLESQVPRMSTIDIPVQQIEDIPALLGEKDVLKVVQYLPGVQKGNEGQTGFYVRGGGPDQNLIILDDATVYNASHLFGFFSVFNGYGLKSVQLNKGGFPARYGGRLSSVLDITMKDGNQENVTGEVGVGLLSSRFTLEGPLIRNKSSFIVSARRTYFDVFTYPLMKKDNRAGYYFYDLNAKINYTLGKADRLYLSAYFGRDNFYSSSTFTNYDYQSGKPYTYSQDASLNWGNQTATLRWNHQYSPKWFSNTSLIYSNYKFNIYAKDEDRNYSSKNEYLSRIQDLGLKHDAEYYASPNHSFRLGLLAMWHKFRPAGFYENENYGGQGQDNYSFQSQRGFADALETAVYGEHQALLGAKWQVLSGLRGVGYHVSQKHYYNLEPRLSVAYQVKPRLTLKAAYALMNQYIHLLTNSSASLPTDLWVTTTDKIRPQRSQQVTLGMVKDLPERKLTLTVEAYYKDMQNMIAFKEGSNFTLGGIDDIDGNAKDNDWERNVTQGHGYSTGLEVLLQKKVGRFSGWAGYTLSFTRQQFAELNLGRWFWAKYDRRHDLSLISVYKVSKSFTLSANFIFATGNNYSLPTGRFATYSGAQPFFQPGQEKTSYGNYTEDYPARNNFRAEPYHRLDVGMQFTKQKSSGLRTWELSFYNVYARRNPFVYGISYDYNMATQMSDTRLIRYALFRIIPSLSWSFKFQSVKTKPTNG